MAKRKKIDGTEVFLDPHAQGAEMMPVEPDKLESEVRVDSEGRPLASTRGYGVAWQNYRARFIYRTGTCIACLGTMDDVYCIDHIIPVRQDHENSRETSGINDPVFWPGWNHQPLCRKHHTQKSHGYDRWYTLNRGQLLTRIEELIKKGQPEHYIRNWLIAQTGMWPDGWFDLNPAPNKQYSVTNNGEWV